MDNKLLRIAHEAGFNTEHPATNEYLRRFAELVREDCAKVALQGTGEPVQTHTLEILKTERERIAAAIRSS